VLGKAIPAGVVIAVATMSVFAIAQLDESIDDDHARTLSVLVAGSVALMNLHRVARPLNTLRRALVGTMITLFALAFVFPWSRRLFELPLTKPWAYAMAAAFIVAAWPLLELGSRLAQRWHNRTQ
jgi:peptidoglycan/LPS O-acetylase OafA/YrhL